MLEDHLGNEHLGALDPQDVIQVSRTDLGRLLAVATLYLDSFGPDEKFSAADLMMLQDIEETVERHGRRC